jgi:hypothetical protein
MSSSTLYRLSGLALVVGGVIAAVFNVISTVAFPSNSNGFDPKVVTGAPWQIVTLLTFIGGVLILLGFPGVYVRQAKETRVLGLIGFILLYLAVLMAGIIFEMITLLIMPYLATAAPKLLGSNSGPPAIFVFFIAFGLSTTVGAILFSIAMLRAHVLPRMAAIMLLIAMVLNLVGFAPLPGLLGAILYTAGSVLFYLALASFGFALMSERIQAPVQVPAVSSTIGTPA